MWFALVVALLAPDTGRVAVDCPQYGRTVAVDRRPVGQTPLAPVTLSTGFHWVEVLDGNDPLWSRLIYVGPGDTLVLTVSLPETGRRRAYRRTAGTQRAPDVPTTYDLAGRVGVVGAALGTERQLGLAQRWRLDARDLAGAPWDARVEATVYNALDDAETPLLAPRYAWPTRPTVLTTAALTHTRPGQVLSLGRQRPMDPTGVPYLLDGVVARAAPTPWLTLTSTFGRRALEPGLEYVSHLVTGLNVEATGHGARVSAYGLYHDGLYLGLDGAMDLGSVAFSGRLQRVGDHFARIQSRAQWRRGGSGRVWFEGAFLRRAEGGFERPLLFEDPLSPPAIREVRARLGGALTLGPAHVEARFRWRRGRTLSDLHSPTVMAARLRAALGAHPSALGLELTWRDHEERPVEGPALQSALGGRVTGRVGLCDFAAGLIEVKIDGRRRRYPEGHARCAAPLSRDLHVFGRLAGEAVHPQIQPLGGPLVFLTAGLELR